MPAKPHRVLLDAVSGYADEAAAYMRRRRHMRKPFARVHYTGGQSRDFSSETETGKALFLAASRVNDAGGAARRVRRGLGGAAEEEIEPAPGTEETL